MNELERMIIAVNLEQAQGTTEGKILQFAISQLKVQKKVKKERGKERRREEKSSSSQEKDLMYYVFCRGEMIPLTLDIESLLIVRPS